jgi:hypothetical protein
VDRKEIQKLEAFFRKRFNMPQMEVRQRPQKNDSAELYIGDEDGDLSYNFTMAILDIDLE